MTAAGRQIIQLLLQPMYIEIQKMQWHFFMSRQRIVSTHASLGCDGGLTIAIYKEGLQLTHPLRDAIIKGPEITRMLQPAHPSRDAIKPYSPLRCFNPRTPRRMRFESRYMPISSGSLQSTHPRGMRYIHVCSHARLFELQFSHPLRDAICSRFPLG